MYESKSDLEGSIQTSHTDILNAMELARNRPMNTQTLSAITLHVYDTLPKDIQMTRIAAGQRFVAVLTDQGDLYLRSESRHIIVDKTTGKERKRPSSAAFTLMEGLRNLASICAGKDHLLILDNFGQVWSCGSNKFGQLGRSVSTESDVDIPLISKISPVNSSACTPTAQSTFTVTQISAGWSHSICLTLNSEVFAFGRNDKGQVSSQTNEIKIGIPLLLPMPSSVVQVAAGSEHCLAVTDTGGVLAWGWNEHGNCGLPLCEAQKVTSITGDSIAYMIAAGCATSWFLVHNPAEE